MPARPEAVSCDEYPRLSHMDILGWPAVGRRAGDYKTGARKRVRTTNHAIALSMNTKYRAVIFGIIASAVLLTLYFAVLARISGWSYTKIQFAQDWYWIVALAVGFGVQVFLFSYARALHKARMSGKVLGVTGTTSGAAMLACCTHYLVNVLPFLGIAGLATFAGQYQTELFAAGVLSNLAGIAYLIHKLRNVYGGN